MRRASGIILAMGQTIDTSHMTYVARLLRNAAPTMPEQRDAKLFPGSRRGADKRASKMTYGVAAGEVERQGRYSPAERSCVYPRTQRQEHFRAATCSHASTLTSRIGSLALTLRGRDVQAPCLHRHQDGPAHSRASAGLLTGPFRATSVPALTSPGSRSTSGAVRGRGHSPPAC